MDRKLLDLLACPATRQPLRLADGTELGRINARIAQGGVARGDGGQHRSPIDAALVTADGARAYRIDDGIPVLLVEESLQLEPAPDAAG